MDIQLLEWERHSAAASAWVVRNLGAQTSTQNSWEGNCLWLLQLLGRFDLLALSGLQTRPFSCWLFVGLLQRHVFVWGCTSLDLSAIASFCLPRLCLHTVSVPIDI